MVENEIQNLNEIISKYKSEDRTKHEVDEYRSKIMEEQDHIISQKENEVKLCIEKLKLAIENIDALNSEVSELETQLRGEKQRSMKLNKKCISQEERIKALSQQQFRKIGTLESYYERSIDSDSQVSR